MHIDNTSYVEPPTIPEGMTCEEYRRKRGGTSVRAIRRRLTTRVRRALRV